VHVCNYRPEQRSYSVCIPTCRQEERTRMVPVCTMRPETQTYRVRVPECVPEQRTENYTVHVCNYRPEQRSYTVRIPTCRQEERTRMVPVSPRRPKTQTYPGRVPGSVPEQ